MILSEVTYTNKGKRIGEGSETRILSDRESESFKYQWDGENPNSISMSFSEFQDRYKKIKEDNNYE